MHRFTWNDLLVIICDPNDHNWERSCTSYKQPRGAKGKIKREIVVDLHLLLKYTLISIKVAPVKRDAWFMIHVL